MDWMSLLPVMNNCNQPSASLKNRKEVQRICGLCHFSTSHKAGFWKRNPRAEFPRVTAESSIWADFVHLFGALPSCIVWEPLHTHTLAVSPTLSCIFFRDLDQNDFFFALRGALSG